MRRGKSGQPPVLGIVSGYLTQAAKFRSRLNTWQRLNPSGRRRRSESREAMAAVIQFLIAREFQLDSRRCARRKVDYHQAIDCDLMARQISDTPAWRGRPPISTARIRAVLRDFKQCGYLKLSHQQRTQRTTGEWIASPKVITLTKTFFLELGGKKLWRKIAREGRARVDRLVTRFQRAGADPVQQLQGYFRLSRILSPRQARERPPDRPVPAT